MKTAGIILDLYDDPNARVLRERLGQRPLPEKLASMDLMAPEKLKQLPNRLYAFVGVNGGETLRKYAMHDEPHLVSSLIYFMETGHLLPEEAQKVAAHNLCLGCHWYGVEPPERIVKLAGIGSAVGALAAGATMASEIGPAMEGKRRTMDQFRQAQATGATVGTKAAELTGTEMMPVSASLKGGGPKRTNTAKEISVASKTASGRFLEMIGPHLEQVGWRGPVDVTLLEAPVVQKVASFTNYALGDRYPIDSIGQVKTAGAYFEEHWGAFSPVDRHVFATNLQDRADDVGLGDMGGMVREYSGHSYGTKIAGELKSRIRGMNGSEHAPVYEMLLEKVASTPPEILAQILLEADQATGVVEGWNKPIIGYMDPYRAVFSKTADDTDPEKGRDVKQWSWSSGSDSINDTIISDFALNGRPALRKYFGDDFAKDFCKDPVTVFGSLPDPQKHAIARMAGDNSGGSYRKT